MSTTIEVDNQDVSEQELALLRAIEAHDGSAGNMALMKTLSWNRELYFAVRNRLVDQGKLVLGRGKGGSVSLANVRDTRPVETMTDALIPREDGRSVRGIAPRMREDELYGHVAEVIRSEWALDKRYRDLVVELTARQGRRDTGGRWTRPDIALATMNTLLYVPGKFFEVITFEVKPCDAIDVTSVYEALAHRRAATRSYVWLHVPEEAVMQLSESIETITSEARRHGIGVITGADANNYETWEEMVEPVRVEPDPQRLNEFLAAQFSDQNKYEILRWMR